MVGLDETNLLRVHFKQPKVMINGVNLLGKKMKMISYKLTKLICHSSPRVIQVRQQFTTLSQTMKFHESRVWNQWRVLKSERGGGKIKEREREKLTILSLTNGISHRFNHVRYQLSMKCSRSRNSTLYTTFNMVDQTQLPTGHSLFKPVSLHSPILTTVVAFPDLSASTPFLLPVTVMKQSTMLKEWTNMVIRCIKVNVQSESVRQTPSS